MRLSQMHQQNPGFRLTGTSSNEDDEEDEEDAFLFIGAKRGPAALPISPVKPAGPRVSQARLCQIQMNLW